MNRESNRNNEGISTSSRYRLVVSSVTLLMLAIAFVATVFYAWLGALLVVVVLLWHINLVRHTSSAIAAFSEQVPFIAIRLATGIAGVAVGLAIVEIAGGWPCELAGRSLPFFVVGLVASYAIVLVYDNFLERAPWWPKFLMLACLVVALIVAWYLLGANVQARFWLVDDHEIMYYMGTDQRLTIGEYTPVLLQKTELGEFGKSPRCRPIYHILRVLECILWGPNPALWYCARIAMFVFCFTVLMFIVRRWIGLPAAFGFGVALLQSRYWIDIWTRLGPAEHYGALGLALFALGFFGVRTRRGISFCLLKRTRLEWLLLILGTVISAGAKENMQIMILPAAFLFMCSLRHRAQRTGAVIATCMVVYVIFLAVATVSGVSARGHFYGEEIALGQRFISSFQVLIEEETICPSVLLMCGIILYGISQCNSGIHRVRQLNLLASHAVGYGLFWSIWLLSQQFFYGNGWPVPIRYAFPGLLAVPLAALSGWILLLRLLEVLGIDRRMLSTLRNGLAAALLLVPLATLGGPLRHYSRQNVKRTSKFWKYHERLITAANENPDRPILLVVNRFSDYEPVVSMVHYLRAYRVRNQVFLKYVENVRIQDDEAQKDFFRQKSMNGNEEISPLKDLDGKDCIVVAFGDVTIQPCETSIRICLLNGYWTDIL